MQYKRYDYIRINNKNSKYHDYNGVILGTLDRPQQSTVYLVAVQITESIVRRVEVSEDSLVYCGHKE